MRADKTVRRDDEFERAFVDSDRQERIRSGKVACVLVMLLMPAGVVLDFFVYPDRVGEFFLLRLLCSLLAGLWWSLHHTSFGFRYYRFLGIPIAILPAVFISWMIATTEGPTSPYYAGLILILLAVNAIVHWTTGESMLALTILFLFYFMACWSWPLTQEQGIFFNNIYFLLLTGIIVVIGNYLYNRLHFREFVLRFELGQNRRRLEETNRKLVELDRIKTRFFANISHELRTPLTLLLTPLQGLVQSTDGVLDPEIRQQLIIMQSNGMRLLKLINDLLDLVRLESGKMEVNSEPVAIDGLLRGVASAVKKTAEDRAIRLEVKSGRPIGSVVTDGDKLERILLNLLFNALKFTPAGGTVQVGATQNQNELVLEVSDTGTGISREHLPYIFDRFWQADTSSKRKNQGVGIGLALVKELVEIQGGKVSVASELGKGTQFRVQLPCQELQSASPTVVANGHPPAWDGPLQSSEVNGTEPRRFDKLDRQVELYPSMTSLKESIRPVETGLGNGKPRLLIADDEPDMLKYLKSQLSLEFQVIEAVDGLQTIEKASQFLPDVIVCDMMMPEKSGLEICRELRQRTYTQSIPILMLTARADEETKLTVLSAGANDFITKPFSTTELKVRLKNLVETFRLQQQLSRQNQVLEATIEQLKETEAQLVHSEKLASLGRMSAGLIHEINNPLNYAKTGLYLLQKMVESRQPEEQSNSLEILQDVQEGINRIDRIVSDLRTFTHPNISHIEKISARELVNSAFRLLGHEWQGKVNIANDIPEDQTIWANRNQVIQVLVNLLQNALYALDKKFQSETAATIWIHGVEGPNESCIIVRDNGEGISSENMPKIFDPFFTSKDVGEGMGLGLSICYRIMQQHGGAIEVQSEEGMYSEFTLRFPQTPQGFTVA